jgi:hypothetical protein
MVSEVEGLLQRWVGIRVVDLGLDVVDGDRSCHRDRWVSVLDLGLDIVNGVRR